MSEPYQALRECACPLMEFWGNKEPKCPHCGASFDIEDNDAYELYTDNDDSHTVYCPECDMEFEVVTMITHRFSTDDQPAPEEAS